MLFLANDPTAEWLAQMFHVLADPLRARILSLLSEQELCVADLVDILHTIQPLVSRHLSLLRRLELVEARRDGKWVHYTLRPPHNEAAAAVLSESLRQLKRIRSTQRDLARLATHGRVKTRLKGAPLP